MKGHERQRIYNMFQITMEYIVLLLFAILLVLLFLSSIKYLWSYLCQ